MKKNILIAILFTIVIISCKKETEPTTQNPTTTIPPTTPDPKIKAIYETLGSQQWAGTNTSNNRHLVLNFSDTGKITGNVERDNSDIFYDACAGHYAVTADSSIIGKYLVAGTTDSVSINAKLRSSGTGGKTNIQGSLNNTMIIGLTPNQLKDFVGIWSGTYSSNMYSGNYYVLFFTDKTFKIKDRSGIFSIINIGSYNLDNNNFSANYSSVRLSGTLNNNTITGNWFNNGNTSPDGTFTITKQP